MVLAKNLFFDRVVLFAYLEDRGHSLFTASISTVEYGEKRKILSQSPASRAHQLADIAKKQ